MEKCSENKDDITEAISAFDTLYTTNHMKMLKLLFPYLEPEHQKLLALYIKWQELMFTLNFFKHNSSSFYLGGCPKKKTLNPDSLLPALTPYCLENEKKILSQFIHMQSMMKKMEELQQYLPMIQQLMSSMSGENMNFGDMTGFGGGNMMDMMKNMLSEEQQEMFSSFMSQT